MVLPDKTGWYKVTGFGEEYILYITVAKYDLWATRIFVHPSNSNKDYPNVNIYNYHRYTYQNGHGWEDRENNSHIWPRDFEFITDKR